MTYLALIVKGNSFQAAHAAANRGLGFTFVRETSNETIGKVAIECRNKVAAWFAEAPVKAPLPIGTLLYYHEYREEAFHAGRVCGAK